MDDTIFTVPNYRIGNDLPISFFVEINQGGMVLSPDNTTILFFDPHGIAVDMRWSISGNQVSGTFLGKDQKRTGLYTLKVILNKDDYGMATSDRQMFRLVPHTWQGDTEPAGWEGFTVSMTDVISVDEMEEIRNIINEGFPDLEGRVNDAIEESQRVNTETQELEHSVEGAERLRVTAEERRADAESLRVEAEQGRVNTEALRVHAESLRVQAETARDNAETLRAQAERDRSDAETLRRTAEQERSDAGTLREQAEGTRQQNEQTRQNQETKREEDMGAIKTDYANLKLDYASLKSDAQQATSDANDAAQNANDKAGEANSAAQDANDKGTYAKNQGDYAKQKADEIEDAKGTYQTLDARLDAMDAATDDRLEAITTEQLNAIFN